MSFWRKFRDGSMLSFSCCWRWRGLAAAAQEMPRVQVFGGYSYTRFDSPSFGFSNPSGLNGYTFSPAYNLIRGFGVVAELSGQYGPNVNLRDIAVGPQFLYPEGKMMFFAHLLFGEARSLVQVGGPQEDTSASHASWAVAWTTTLLPALPCAHSRWITSTPTLFPEKQNNFRFSTGLVYRWGTIKKRHRTLAPNP